MAYRVEGTGEVHPRASTPVAAPAPASLLEAASFRFHHVGVAVRDLEAALGLYVELFGFRRLTGPVAVPAQHVRVAFLEAGPGVLIELIAGLDEQAPVRGILERSGAGPYHLCYEVDDLDAAVRRLRKKQCRVVTRFEQESGGLHRFAFLVAPDGELFELCEGETFPS